VLRFYLRILKRLPRVIYDAASIAGTLAVLVAAGVLAFNRPLARQVLGWSGFSPIWAVAPCGLIVVYGLAKTNYEEARRLGAATNRTEVSAAPITINNYYGPVRMIGANSAESLPPAEPPASLSTEETGTETESRR
jgi:hypothetical protein